MNLAAKNSRWRIIACDLDGTLIGWNQIINDRDVSALRAAHAAGFHVAICTGRNSRECSRIIAALGLEDLGVFVNGAMVCRMNSAAAVHSVHLDPALERAALHFFASRGHAVLALIDHPASRLPVYCRTNHGPAHPATVDWLRTNRVTDQLVEQIPVEFAGRLVRIGVVVNVPEAQQLFAELQETFGQNCAAHSIYSPRYDCQIIELFHPQVNKWTGLAHLAEAIGAAPEQIITIGDDTNDLPMLDHAALSFAVADARPEIRARAKRTTRSHADCGVAAVIDALLAGALESDPAPHRSLA